MLTMVETDWYSKLRQLRKYFNSSRFLHGGERDGAWAAASCCTLSSNKLLLVQSKGHERVITLLCYRSPFLFWSVLFLHLRNVSLLLKYILCWGTEQMWLMQTHVEKRTTDTRYRIPAGLFQACYTSLYILCSRVKIFQICLHMRKIWVSHEIFLRFSGTFSFHP